MLAEFFGIIRDLFIRNHKVYRIDFPATIPYPDDRIPTVFGLDLSAATKLVGRSHIV